MPAADRPIDQFKKAGSMAEAEAIAHAHPEVLTPAAKRELQEDAIKANLAYENSKGRTGYTEAEAAESAIRRIDYIRGD